MNNEQDTVRLNKLLALQLGVSRREADEMIQSGRVRVDGTTAQLGSRADTSSAIEINGQPINKTPPLRYIMFNKPVGHVCSRKPQGDTPTIYDILPADMAPLKPVGRLDKDSSGLILLTNDGDFAHSMTHPKFSKVKVYQVALDKPLEPLHQQMITDYGIEIGDGTSKLSLERRDDSRLEWTVTMSEGRNRQIRRTFSSLGYEVHGLHRIVFGAYTLGSLEPGNTESVAKA